MKEKQELASGLIEVVITIPYAIGYFGTLTSAFEASAWCKKCCSNKQNGFQNIEEEIHNIETTIKK
ncbi:MAG: hypothetical protein R2860_01360 [Desulfobacterales bacterium]